MRRRRSVRTRLTLLYGGVFVLGGCALVVLTLLLVNQFLPQPGDIVTQRVGGGGGAVTSGSGTDAAADPQMVALLNDFRTSALRTVVIQAAVALGVTAAIALLFGWLLAGRILRPLHDMAATAKRLGAEDLDQRLPVNEPDELGQLADTFNGMLDRLADSFDSQRRFVANASHELRTPLAVQRALAEVALADPAVTPDMRKLCERLLLTNERSERLIEGLLVLAKSERGLDNKRPVRLDEVAGKVLDATVVEEIELRLDLRPRVVPGDAVLLERVVTNLVQNALRYNEPGGWIRVEVGESPALVVENTGPPVPAEAIPGLFEPFRRLSTERTRETGGAGLGLSIVRAVVKAHGGTVTAAPSPTGSLAVFVDLP
jgi:signal transduction histidine kinase